VYCAAAALRDPRCAALLASRGKNGLIGKWRNITIAGKTNRFGTFGASTDGTVLPVPDLPELAPAPAAAVAAALAAAAASGAVDSAGGGRGGRPLRGRGSRGTACDQYI
jgi:hypothetical protein